MTPQFERDLLSDPALLPGLREELRGWLLAGGWSEIQADEIVLAVDEALSNVILHGYQSQPQHRIELRAGEIDDPLLGAGLEVRIRDFGRQIDPACIVGRALDEVRPGGLGVHLMRALMNTLTYSRADGGGMQVNMRKFRSHVAAVRPGEASESLG